MIDGTITTQVRTGLVDALQLDLIGPTGILGNPNEVLWQAPSRWYLTGFLVPTDAGEEQRSDPNSQDELDQAAEPAGLDDDNTPESTAARKSYLPSSMGISVLVDAETTDLQAIVRYGEYLRVEHEEGYSGPLQWRRNPNEEILSVPIGTKVPMIGKVEVPNSRGVELVWSVRGVPDSGVEGGLPKVSVAAFDWPKIAVWLVYSARGDSRLVGDYDRARRSHAGISIRV